MAAVLSSGHESLAGRQRLVMLCRLDIAYGIVVVRRGKLEGGEALRMEFDVRCMFMPSTRFVIKMLQPGDAGRTAPRTDRPLPFGTVHRRSDRGGSAPSSQVVYR